MPPQRIVGQLFLAEGKPERLPQHRLAELYNLGIEVGAVRRFGQRDVVNLGHRAPRQQPPSTGPAPQAAHRN